MVRKGKKLKRENKYIWRHFFSRGGGWKLTVGWGLRIVRQDGLWRAMSCPRSPQSGLQVTWDSTHPREFSPTSIWLTLQVFIFSFHFFIFPLRSITVINFSSFFFLPSICLKFSWQLLYENHTKKLYQDLCLEVAW